MFTCSALKVSQSVYCFTTSISHCVTKYFPRLWGMGISDAMFEKFSEVEEFCGNTANLNFIFTDYSLY